MPARLINRKTMKPTKAGREFIETARSHLKSFSVPALDEGHDIEEVLTCLLSAVYDRIALDRPNYPSKRRK